LELTLLLLVCLTLVLGAADFSRLFYTATELTSAARAAAQYGSQSVITAADNNGMTLAARQDAPNIGTVDVASGQCTCNTGSSATLCAPSYCANAPKANYVTVDATATFHTLANYPFLPSSVALTRRAVMQVSQ
jgi:Flp pilus assembly protein TadG